MRVLATWEFTPFGRRGDDALAALALGETVLVDCCAIWHNVLAIWRLRNNGVVVARLRVLRRAANDESVGSELMAGLP